MKLKVVTTLLTVGLLGCGGGPDDQIYDTAGNPDGFPPLAVGLITELQNGRMTGAESITEAFGELYTQHSELLDREDWKNIIVRLGDVFGRKADSLQAGGIKTFTSAAEYYQLASFAQPEDPVFRQKASLFGRWLAASQSSLVDLAALMETDSPAWPDIMAVTHYFLLGDSLDQAFFQTHLVRELNQMIETTDRLGLDGLDQLPPPGRALAVVAGFAPEPGTDKLTTYTSPEIDLAAALISRIDSTSLRVELYFIPREPISEPLQVWVRLQSTEGVGAHIQITPRESAISWQPGRIAMVVDTIQYNKELEAAVVGLSDYVTPRPNFLQPEGSPGVLFLLSPDCLALDL